MAPDVGHIRWVPFEYRTVVGLIFFDGSVPLTIPSLPYMRYVANHDLGLIQQFGDAHRDRRQLLAARGVGRPLPLRDRARPQPEPPVRARPYRSEQGAGLRQSGLARDHRAPERPRRARAHVLR